MATPTDDPSRPTGGKARRRPEARPEDVAEVVLAEWVKGCAAKTSKWLDESSRAFEQHLHKALHPPGYTTAEMVRDVTDVWTRNLAYVVSLFTVTRPDARAREVSADETAETERTKRPPGAAEPAEGDEPAEGEDEG